MSKVLVERQIRDVKGKWTWLRYTVVCGESEPKLKSQAEESLERTREMLRGKA